MTSLFHSARPTADTVRSEAPRATLRGAGWRSHLGTVRAKARYLRLLAWPVYGFLLWRYVDKNGLPYNNDLVFVWLIGALIAAAVHSGNRFGWLRVLRDWVPVMGAVWAYSLLRGYGSHTPWAVHWAPQVAFDKVVGGGQVWTVHLQHWLYTPGHLHWYDYAATTVYMSHFFAVFVVMAALWRKRHERFTRLVALYLALTFAAFATYVLFPADPPWLAAQNGHLPAITRIVQDVLNQSGLPRAGSLFENGSRFDNDVAAMPSLHASYPLLLTLFFWPVAKRRWVKVLLVAYPLAMAFSLIYGGEHFVIDILAGWTYTSVIFFGLNHILDRRAKRRAERLAAAGADDHGGLSHPEKRPAEKIRT